MPEAAKVLALHARAQSKFKGRAFDLMRTAMGDKQYNAIRKLWKE